jgi:hypothetical protein
VQLVYECTTTVMHCIIIKVFLLPYQLHTPPPTPRARAWNCELYFIFFTISCKTEFSQFRLFLLSFYFPRKREKKKKGHLTIIYFCLPRKHLTKSFYILICRCMNVSSRKRDLLKHFSLSGTQEGLFPLKIENNFSI